MREGKRNLGCTVVLIVTIVILAGFLILVKLINKINELMFKYKRIYLKIK